MTAIPQWLTGRGVTVFTMTPQDVSNVGVLSDNAVGALSVAGLWETTNLEMQPEMEEISPSDGAYQNEVILKENWQVTANCIMRKAVNSTGKVNPLKYFIANHDYVKVILTHTSNLSSGGATATWTFYGIRKSYRETANKGKSSIEVTFGMVDISGANPAQSGTP